MPFDRPRALLSTPITHAAGALALPVHFRGGTVYTTNRFDLETVCRTIEKEHIDLIYTVPTVLYKMLEAGLTRKYDLRSLKTIRYGASPISPAKLESLMQEFGPVFVQGYASTESWPPGTILGRAEHGIGSEREIRRLASVGRPVPGVEVRICDDDGRDVRPGDSGEIWIRGPNTIAGYLDDPEQTAANFSKDGFWKSGDVGYMDEEGFLYLVDRKKDMIISGGFNVYAAEVENVLNSHPAVENSAVVGIPDEYWGEAVCGVVLLKSGQSTDEKNLMEFCKDRLARYKAPKKIDFVRELPTSPVGKVLRREVKRRYWQDGGRGIH
jgi:acyl-CoA synthetase (AMP-forming)/AMP-acid ligase II